MLSDFTVREVRLVPFLAALLVLTLLQTSLPRSTAHAAGAGEEFCGTQALPTGTGKDVVVNGLCTVGAGTYTYGDVNIVNGGSLRFGDTKTDFYAKSILIQNGGSLLGGVVNPGSPSETIVPIGTTSGPLVFHLYGAEQADRKNGTGVSCKKVVGTSASVDKSCGIPLTTTINMMAKSPLPFPTCTTNPSLLPGGVSDCFYMYDTLAYDGGGGNLQGFFGYKMIGLSYGGTLRLYGKKGATYTDTSFGTTMAPPVIPSNTGTSWQRLNSCPGKATGPVMDSNNNVVGMCQDGTLQPGATQITLSGPAPVDWQPNDFIILTTTDYLVSHSEVLQIKSVASNGLTITLMTGLQFPHNASTFDVAGRITNRPAPPYTPLTDLTSVDTRAAVGLLTRSIRIVSQGTKPTDPLPAASSKDLNRYFGGHMIIRQGFQQLQLQGVEMFQLGQGGKIGHYPIHFHMTRKVPANTFVKDCSVWDSFTRWIVLHATQGVLLARNVGYRSIGHGYYLEDGTETNNQLYANLGVTAIAAVNDTANNRSIPGIFVAQNLTTDNNPAPRVPYRTDAQHPTLFWLMNGWNDLEYNMAAGAEACGACYWYVPGSNSGGSRLMSWTQNGTPYASEQALPANDGVSPIQEFLGNTCSTATTAFTSIADVGPCNGVGGGGLNTPPGGFTPIPNPLLTAPINLDFNVETYYPIVHGGFRKATLCLDSAGKQIANDCSGVTTCTDSNNGNCAVTTLDHFTTSFNFTETNFAAIWLRPLWNLVINSAMTDVLNGGISFVTGGGYTRSDTPRGLWSVARKSVFIGSSQTATGNKYAGNAGPVTPTSGRVCRNTDINFCIPADKVNSTLDDGSVFQLSNHATNRFFSIYDGPSLEDSNVYLDITPTIINDCTDTTTKLCRNSAYMQGRVLGIPGLGGVATPAARPTSCYLPNAAIAWKQPNGFYYPPAFHSTNLFFNNVAIRHYLIEPKFLAATDASPYPYTTDLPTSLAEYCNVEPSMWAGFTDVDRQTELNDDDGSLTGVVNTISVNSNIFFQAPTQDFECKSDFTPSNTSTRATAKVSPYDYVTTVLYADQCSSAPPPSASCDGTSPTDPGMWTKACTNERCFGVPMHRELLVKGESVPPIIHLSGQLTGQRSTLTPNNGRWYLDTTISDAVQKKTATNLNVFQTGKKYHVFLLFAKPPIPADATNQSVETYDIFVGQNIPNPSAFLATVHAEKANIATQAITFTPFDTSMDTTMSPWVDINPTTGKWIRSYNSTTGMLTVTMDMSLNNFVTDYNNSIRGRCQPNSMCSWSTANSQCQCNTSSTSGGYLPADCSANLTGICKWATADIDYPDAGAYGFSFTLPDQFAYGTQPVPNVSCLTQLNNPQWNVSFQVPQPPIAMLPTDCTYTSSPPAPIFSMNATPGMNGCQ